MGYKDNTGWWNHCYWLLTNGLKIQWGNRPSYATVNFNIIYTTEPVVFAMVNDSNCTTHAQIGDVTNSTFSYRAAQYGTWSESRAMFWMSIGY